jgi:hypothetical protein
LRPQRCDYLLDLPLALVPSGFEDALLIVRGEMWRKQTDRGEVQCTVGEQIEDRRPLPSCPCGLDSKVGGMFRQVQDLRAVGEERGAALANIQLSDVQLGERRNQARSG